MGLIRSTPRSQRRALVAGDVTDWSRDSWRVSHDSAYGAMFADPCVETKGPRPVMDEAMVVALIPVARRQVVAGGLRLAKLLDAALG
jgi:hypothetical protein